MGLRLLIDRLDLHRLMQSACRRSKITSFPNALEHLKKGLHIGPSVFKFCKGFVNTAACRHRVNRGSPFPQSDWVFWPTGLCFFGRARERTAWQKRGTVPRVQPHSDQRSPAHELINSTGQSPLNTWTVLSVGPIRSHTKRADWVAPKAVPFIWILRACLPGLRSTS